MDEIIKIGDENVPVIEWKGERVITTSLLANVYGVTEKNIKQNFNNNEKRFEIGKHYYLLENEELKEFKNLVEDFDLVQKNTPRLFLWTHKGASRHCKMLGTDKAWEQFDKLEDFYFDSTMPTTVEGKIQLLAQGNVELQKQINNMKEDIVDVKTDLQEFKSDIPLFGIECEQITNAKNKKVVPLMGGKKSNAYQNRSLRGKVYSDIDSQLRREFGVSSYKAIKRNQIDKALEIVGNYELPMCLKEEIESENAQMRLTDYESN